MITHIVKGSTADEDGLLAVGDTVLCCSRQGAPAGDMLAHLVWGGHDGGHKL